MNEMGISVGSQVNVSKLINKACETGDWSKLGFEPKGSCKCFGRGYRGYLYKSEDKGVPSEYNICGCVKKAYPFILTYVTDSNK